MPTTMFISKPVSSGVSVISSDLGSKSINSERNISLNADLPSMSACVLRIATRLLASWALLLPLVPAVGVLGVRGQEGSVDATFQSPLFDLPVPFVEVEADGKVLCCYTASGNTRYLFARLTSTGALESQLAIGDGAESITPAIDVGTIHIPGATNAATVNVIKPLPNGQILVGGTFSHFSKVPRKLVARLNHDGSVDTTFNTATTLDGDNVSTISLLGNGKIYVGGKFNKAGGVSRNIGLVRLNADGTLDTTFVDGTISFGANVTGCTLQPDGKPVIDTAYANSSFQATIQVYRLGVDGGLDPTFSQGAGSPVTAAALRHSLLPNGQILVSGTSPTYNGASVNAALFRLNADGTLDTSYPKMTLGLVNVGGLIGRYIPAPSGKTYISGAFDTVNGQSRHSLARLNPDGSLDPAFSPDVYVSPGPGSVSLQPDGKILVCAIAVVGTATKYQVVRLNGGGTTPPAAPQLGTFAFLGGGTNQVQVAGGAGTVVVQASADLVSWAPVATNSVAGGVLRFVDPFASPFAVRFYRLLVP